MRGKVISVFEARPQAESGKRLRVENQVEPLPDQSLKIMDILKRFVKGVPIEAPAGKGGVYPETVSHDSPDLGKLAMMDKTDQLDYARGFNRIKLKPKPKPEPEPEPKPVAKPDGKSDKPEKPDKPTE